MTELNGKDEAFYTLLASKINRVLSAAKPVCDTRPELSELGDTVILKDLDSLCKLFEIGEDTTRVTGGFGAIVAAQYAVENELIKKLHNDVTLKLGR